MNMSTSHWLKCLILMAASEQNHDYVIPADTTFELTPYKYVMQ